MGFLGVLGLVLLVVALVLFFVRRSQSSKLRDLRLTQVTPVSEVLSLASAVAGELGRPGLVRQKVALEGIARCDQPILTESEEQPCIAFTTTVTREYEETYTETNSSSGRTETRTRCGTEQVSSTRRSTGFLVDDGSGQLAVDPEGADVDLVEVTNRFEPAEQSMGEIQFGAFRMSLPALSGSGRRTLGYRIVERILPVESRIFLLGELTDVAGKPVVRRPDGGGRFVISRKSGEELKKSTVSSVKWLGISSAASAVVGALLVVADLAR